MSHSPTETPDAAWVDDEGSEYRQRWERLNALVEQGNSWSGNERNCFFLNLGNGRFCDVSGATGFDFAGDGRGLAMTDWDGDGDLDVWLSNRTAPRVQFLENRSPGGNQSLVLRLVGDGQRTSRDAIGARVVVHLNPNPALRTPISELHQTVRAGEGFLSQGSKKLHFGLGADHSIESLSVHWPGGEVERISGAGAGGEYEIVQGSGTADRVPPRAPASLHDPVDWSPVPDNGRLILSSRLPLPPLAYTSPEGEARALSEFRGKPVLLNLWAPWCAPCLTELREFAEQADALRGAGITIVALSVDEPGKARDALQGIGYPFESGTASARLVELLHLLYHHVYAKPHDLPVPTSFLVDADGRLAAIYRGAVGVETLLADTGAIASGSGLASELTGGTWAVKPAPAALGDLAWDLLFSGFTEEGAAFVLEHKARFGHGAGYTRMIGKTATELLKLGDHKSASALFNEVVDLEPDDLMSRNNLAWIQATSPDPEARDGAAALRHAEHAARLTDQKNPAVLETLAAAYAEAGRFADAIATTGRAVELARAAANTQLLGSLTRAQIQYKAGRPLRMR